MIITKDHLDLPVTIVTPTCTIYIKDTMKTFISQGKECSVYRTEVRVSKNSSRNSIEAYQPTTHSAEILVLQEDI